MNYDFEEFKKLYGIDSKDDSSMTSETNEETSLYDELMTTSSEKFDNLILDNDVPTPSIESIKDEAQNDLEKTMEIDTFELDYEMSEALEPPLIKEEKPKKKKRFHLPFTTADSHHLEYAFAHCAVLGFITAAMGSGMLIYILNHMNSL